MVTNDVYCQAAISSRTLNDASEFWWRDHHFDDVCKPLTRVMVILIVDYTWNKMLQMVHFGQIMITQQRTIFLWLTFTTSDKFRHKVEEKECLFLTLFHFSKPQSATEWNRSEVLEYWNMLKFLQNNKISTDSQTKKFQTKYGPPSCHDAANIHDKGLFVFAQIWWFMLPRCIGFTAEIHNGIKCDWSLEMTKSWLFHFFDVRKLKLCASLGSGSKTVRTTTSAPG